MGMAFVGTRHALLTPDTDGRAQPSSTAVCKAFVCRVAPGHPAVSVMPLASFCTGNPFSSFVLSQSIFRFTSPDMMLSSPLSSLGVPRQGLAVTLYSLIIPMACSTTIRVPLISLLRARSSAASLPVCLSESRRRLAGCRIVAPGYPRRFRTAGPRWISARSRRRSEVWQTCGARRKSRRLSGRRTSPIWHSPMSPRIPGPNEAPGMAGAAIARPRSAGSSNRLFQSARRMWATT